MSIELVREVRSRSNVSLNECKKALEEAGGDVEKALVIIQKKGLQKAVAREGRIASEGTITQYDHNGRIGVMSEVNCETDFVSRSPDYKAFCEAVNLQIASMSPVFVRREEVPEAEIETQREVFTAQLVAEKKPLAAIEKIMPGKFNKWYSEVCLLEQDSVMHPGKTIEQLRVELVAKTGENITVRRFVRWEVGQGIARAAVKDYAQEVSELTGVTLQDTPDKGVGQTSIGVVNPSRNCWNPNHPSRK
jgi:elongation factor Ts